AALAAAALVVDAPPLAPPPEPTRGDPAVPIPLGDRPATLPEQAAARTAPLAPLAARPSDRIVGPPSLSPELIQTILACYRSPASSAAAEFYAAGQAYAIDPA